MSAGAKSNNRPVIETYERWYRRYAGQMAIGAAGVLVVLGFISAAPSFGHHDRLAAQRALDASNAQVLSGLRGDLASASASAASTHDAVVDTLGQGNGLDSARLVRDKVAVQSVLSAVTSVAWVTPDVLSGQQYLARRFSFLGNTSRTLTQFVPDWDKAAMAGVPYSLAGISTTPSAALGKDGFSYTVLAELDPVPKEGQQGTGPQYVWADASVDANGSVSMFTAYLVSSSLASGTLPAPVSPVASLSPSLSPSPSPTAAVTG